MTQPNKFSTKDDETTCCVCGRDVTEGGGLCCTSASYDDGRHDDPVCRQCCNCGSGTVWDGKSVAGGTYQASRID